MRTSQPDRSTPLPSKHTYNNSSHVIYMCKNIICPYCIVRWKKYKFIHSYLTGLSGLLICQCRLGSEVEEGRWEKLKNSSSVGYQILLVCLHFDTDSTNCRVDQHLTSCQHWIRKGRQRVQSDILTFWRGRFDRQEEQLLTQPSQTKSRLEQIKI